MEFATKPPKSGVRARVFEEINLLYVVLTKAIAIMYVLPNVFPIALSPTWPCTVSGIQAIWGCYLTSYWL